MKLEIYCGYKEPRIAVGANQCSLLEFAERYRGWHSYKHDRATISAIKGLVRRRGIELNQFGQFRFRQGEVER